VPGFHLVVRLPFAVFSSVLSLIACGPEPPPRSPAREEQSYPEAIRLICEVDARVNADPEDVLAVSAAREEFLIAHVKNGDGIYFLTLFRVNGPKEQAAMLEKEASGAKITVCPLVATLRQEQDSPPEETSRAPGG
jgi:hypothetical protein